MTSESALPVTLTTEAKAKLDTVLADASTSGYPPIVLGVVNAAGDVQYLEGSDGAKVHWTASLTKLVTSIAALQLVEAGKLTLDDSLVSIAPELSHRAKFVNDDSDDLRTVPAETDITLRHLLTHTSGLGYGSFNRKTLNWFRSKYGVDAPGFDNFDIPLTFEPGTGFEYGISTDWLGRVIQRVTGASLDSYFQEHIFSPLGTTDAVLTLKERPDLAGNLAGLHFQMEDGTYKKIPYHDLLKEPAEERGGEALWTTPCSYLRLLSAILDGGVSPHTGYRLLEPETLEEMFAPQTLHIPNQGALALDGVMPSAVPTTTLPIPLLPGQKKAWTLSHLTNLEELPNGRSAGSGEWYGICNLFWTVDREMGIAAVAFSQVFPFGVPEFFEIVEKTQKIIFAPGALQRRETKGSA